MRSCQFRQMLSAGIDISLYRDYVADTEFRQTLGLPPDIPLVASLSRADAPLIENVEAAYVCVSDLELAADFCAALSQVNVFLATSREAVFSYVTCEAMALGVPVIAAHLPNAEEVVIPGVTGILVPPENIHLFTAAIRLLVTNSDLRGRMGQASRQHAMKQFDLWRMNAHLEALYRSAKPDNT